MTADWYTNPRLAGHDAHEAGLPRFAPAPPAGNPVGGPWADNARLWYLGWDQANMAENTWKPARRARSKPHAPRRLAPV